MAMRPYKQRIKDERNADIYSRYHKLGMSMGDIAEFYKISRERVRQILEKEKEKRNLKNRFSS